MTTIDRRTMMRSLAGGLAVGALGATGVGLLASQPLKAAPLPIDTLLPARTDDLVQKAQAVVVGPPRRHVHHRRRRRRWVCWWRGRRRVCGWRWV